MRQIVLRTFVLLAVMLLIGTMVATDAAERRGQLREAVSDSSGKTAFLGEQLVYQSGWANEIVAGADASVEFGESNGPPGPGAMLAFEREILVEGIAHYTADVRIGDGPHDVIRLHRVVMESRPYRPIRTGKNIFLLHGDAVGFVKFIFGSASLNAPDERSVAVYLAQNGVDVWGMDQDWILVPEETTDFGFMENWGLQRQVDNLDIAVGVARHARRSTGNGYARMNVLGYSSGAATVYAFANQESQLPPGHRKMGGLIPVDFTFRLDPANSSAIEWACGASADLRAAHESGVYEDASGQLFLILSFLASSAPDDPSPIFPGLTNFQAALFFNTNTYALSPLNDWWHYMAGLFDENGLPYDLSFTTVDVALDFMASASPYESLAFPLDFITMLCGDIDLPFDDHIDQITLPVLYIGPAGGIGVTGVYATTLLGSSDVSLLMPQFLPDDERVLDIGHIDIWTAEAAEESVWQPLLDWILAHSVGRP